MKTNISIIFSVFIILISACEANTSSSSSSRDDTVLSSALPEVKSITYKTINRSIILKWTAPTLDNSHKKADGTQLTQADVSYKVYRVVKGAKSRTIANIISADNNPLAVAAGTTSTNITNLNKNTTYEIVVQAVNATDTTKISTGIRAEVTVLSTNFATAPEEVSDVAGIPTDTSARITWIAPTLTNSHKKADGTQLTNADVSYKVYRVAKGAESRTIANIISADNNPLAVAAGTTSTNITNLNKNTTYEIVVQAVNTTDTTKVSTGIRAEVTTLKTNQATDPADARSVTGSSTDTSASISWTAPTLTSVHKKADGTQLTKADVSYKVYRVAKGDNARTVDQIKTADTTPLAVAAGTTSINITNLNPNTTYEIVVQSVNTTDATKVSTGVEIEVTTTSLATAPADARSVRGSPADTSVRVSWQAPTLDNSHKKADGTQLTNADVSYKVYRVAKGSNVRTVDQIKTADNNPITVKGTTSINITNLMSSTTYEIVVQSVNTTDVTKVSTGVRVEVTTLSINQATAPADARSVRGSPTDTSVGVSWQAPTLDNSHKKADGTQLTKADVSYKVYRVAKGSKSRTVAEIKTADTTPLAVAKGTTNTSITNLTGGTTYEVVVQAVNATNTTKVSTGVRIEVTTISQATAPPDVPFVDPTQNGISDRKISIVWFEPTLKSSHKKANGRKLTDKDIFYKVYHVAKGKNARTVAEIKKADPAPLELEILSVEITNLTPKTTYEIVVQAVNATDPTKASTGIKTELTTLATKQ